MGVPISFLDKYNPDQFEIVGNSDDGEMMRRSEFAPSARSSSARTALAAEPDTTARGCGCLGYSSPSRE